MAFVYIDTSPKVFTFAGAHTHPNWEIILTVEGEGSTCIGEAEFPVRPGSIHVVPPRTPHVKQSPSGFKDIYLHVDSMTAFGLRASSPPFCVEDDSLGTVATLMKNMLYRFLRDNKKDTSLTLMCELVLHLVMEKRALPTTDPVVEQVRSFLALNYNDPELSLADALSSTGYQRDYVRRRFAASCGLTPGEYLTSLRMDRAKTLLMNRQEHSVAEIGVLCGYYDARYFSRAFKKATGHSPEEYRRLSSEISPKPQGFWKH